MLKDSQEDAEMQQMADAERQDLLQQVIRLRCCKCHVRTKMTVLVEHHNCTCCVFACLLS